MSIIDAEKAIGYAFKDKSLLTRALTLSSASMNENNQRLEFFGDAVLEFLVSEKLFEEEGSEGQLTERRKSLVADSVLAPVSEKLGLDKMLVRGKNDDNNKKAVPSVYEAVVAAIYIDGGMEAAKQFVYSTLDFSRSAVSENYKGALQELLQGSGQPCPEYIREDIGTEQKHLFSVKINVFGKTFCGEAENVKNAEQIAAKSAVEYYNVNHGESHN